MPYELDDVAASPLMCAGVTTYNALRLTGPAPVTSSPCSSSAVSVTSACSTPSTMGFLVSSIALGTDKAYLATYLGAHHYIYSTATDPA